MTDGLALAVRGLRKSYAHQVALAGLELSVPVGVVYGFLGPPPWRAARWPASERASRSTSGNSSAPSSSRTW